MLKEIGVRERVDRGRYKGKGDVCKGMNGKHTFSMAPCVVNKSCPGSGSVESTAMLVASEGEEQGSTAPDLRARRLESPSEQTGRSRSTVRWGAASFGGNIPIWERKWCVVQVTGDR